MNRLINTVMLALPILIVIIMGILIYSPAAKYDFVWDDEVHIVKNVYDTEIAEQGFKKYWLPHPKLLYAPFTYSIWALAKNLSLNEYGVLKPGIFHQLNIFFHLLNTILIYLILLRLKMSRTGVFLGIIVFCFHPLQVEAVCWTSAFRTVFCGFWSFLSVYLYLLYLQSRKSNLIYYLSAFFCFGAALLSKPLAVILPLFLIFISRHIKKESFLPALTRLIPFLIVSVISIIFTMNNGEPVLNEIKPIPARLLVFSDTILFYFRKLLFPVGLSSYYGRTPTKILQENLVYFSWLFPVLAGLILYRFRSKLRAYLPAVLIFVIGFLPVSGLVTFEGQNWNTAADRYLYLSFLGIAWLISVLADSIRNRRYVYFLLFIILIWTGITAFDQVRIWENNETVWTRAIEITHNDEIPYNRRGVTHYHQGNYSKALADLTHALEINPDHYQSLYARGLVYQKMQQSKLAISDYSSALRLQPTDPDLIYNRALMLISSGSYQLAIADLNRVIEINPEDTMAYYNRAAVYFYLGNYRNAWDDLIITEKLGGYVNPDFKKDVIHALEQGK